MANTLIASDIKCNNFDLMRLVLAVLVLYSHCFIIYYGDMDREPVSAFSHGQIEFGILAVFGFFLISGFLIARSFEQSSSVFQYLWKRMLRIVPGFVVAYVISVLLVGPVGAIYSQSPKVNWQFYFTDTRWLRVAVEMFTLQAPHVGVCFTDMHCPKLVNASLWTIQHEAICYLLIVIFAAWGLFKTQWLWATLFVAAFAFSVFLDSPVGVEFRGINTLPMMWPGLLPKHLMYFLAGTGCYLYRDKLPRHLWLVFFSVVAILISMYWGGFHLVFPFAGTYVLFYIAFHPRLTFPDFARHGDFSYGAYLYAWPAQQLTLYALGDKIGVNGLFVLSLAFTIGCAALSWYFVEHRFLRMKLYYPLRQQRI